MFGDNWPCRSVVCSTWFWFLLQILVDHARFSFKFDVFAWNVVDFDYGECELISVVSFPELSGVSG